MVFDCGILVVFMNAGFGCVEASFYRVKNVRQHFGWNFVVFVISSIAFWVIGSVIMSGMATASGPYELARYG